MRDTPYACRVGSCLWCLLFTFVPVLAQPTTQPQTQPSAQAALQHIAFGSCVDPHKPVPAFQAIQLAKPDLMIFMGDNIYADTTDPRKLEQSYRALGNHPGFRQLKNTCPILATWDDHDYGLNDLGKEHPTKQASQQVFMDFWGIPKDSPRRMREGVYDAQIFGPDGKRVQIILLDTRYHRDPLTPRPKGDNSPGGGRYIPNPDPSATILGGAQWAWLKEQLTQPADLRLIVSSIQFVAEEHGWEGWALFPAERTRFIELIRSTNANGVIFLSGDRHHAELSRLDQDTPYPLYDITSSALNKPGREHEEPNRHRIGELYSPTNFGLITVDWELSPPTVAIGIIDPTGQTRIEHTLALTELAP